MKKFNKSQIFSQAWSFVKTLGLSFSNSLKKAWSIAKGLTEVTIEAIAEAFGAKVWSKGDISRVYINRGYNTKKMQTKTYIYVVDGVAKVSCFIECYNQPMEWCKNNATRVADSVREELSNLGF